MKLDWKFLLLFLAAVAAPAGAVWQWLAENSAGSLSIIETPISIQPKEHGAISGIEISVDGTRLVNPHLVVFEIRNNGRKPIPAADYESPLQINVVSETKLVRAKITDKAPKDIDATLMSESKSFSLKPMLLNPGNTVSVIAITSGDPPRFNYKARIVGVTLDLEDGTTKKPNKIKLASLLLGSVLLFISFSLVNEVIIFKASGLFLRKRAAVFVGISAIPPATIMLLMFLEGIGMQEFWYFLLSALILIILASLIAIFLNRKQKTTASDEVAK